MKTETTHNRVYYILAFLIGIFSISGIMLRIRDGYGKGTFLIISLFLSLLLCPMICKGLLIIQKKIYIRSSDISDKEYRILPWYCYIIPVFLIQFPFFLAFYPGICTFDLPSQMEQYDSWIFTSNHPLIHTLYVGFLRGLFDDHNKGYALANMIQMIVLDSVISYAVYWVDCRMKRTWIRYALVLGYAFHPVVIFLSMSCTKDVLFTAFALLHTLLLCNESEGKRSIANRAMMVVSCVFMLLLRNNAIYAYLLFSVLLFVIFAANKRKATAMFLCIIAALLIYFSVNRVLIFALDANATSVKEIMSVPAQGDGRLYSVSNDITERELIKNYIEYPEKYEYYIADPMKSQLPFDVIDSKCKHFLLDSAILALHHPTVYVDAFLYNTQGYWDIMRAPYQYERTFLAPLAYKVDAVLDSKLPWLTKICQTNLYSTGPFVGTPVIILLNMALYIWVTLYGLTRGIYEKNCNKICLSLLPMTYLLTLLLGPAAITRYAFLFYLIAPVVLLYSLQIDKEIENRGYTGNE